MQSWVFCHCGGGGGAGGDGDDDLVDRLAYGFEAFFTFPALYTSNLYALRALSSRETYINMLSADFSSSSDFGGLGISHERENVYCRR